jgi:hypothetical protein
MCRNLKGGSLRAFIQVVVSPPCGSGPTAEALVESEGN